MNSSAERWQSRSRQTTRVLPGRLSNVVCLLLPLLLALVPAAGAAGQYPPTRPGSPLLDPSAEEAHKPVTLRLISEYEAVRPGVRFHLAACFDISPGWSIFWRNPGDLPRGATRITLQAPDGVEIGEPNWSGPLARVTPAGFAEYFHQEKAAVVYEIRIPTNWKEADQLTFRALGEWTAVGRQITQSRSEATIAISLLDRGEPLRVSDEHADLLNALAHMPAGAEDLGIEVETRWDGPDLLVSTPAADLLTFFPHASEDWTVENAADCIAKRDGQLRIRIGDAHRGRQEPITGVLAIGTREGRSIEWAYVLLSVDRRESNGSL